MFVLSRLDIFEGIQNSVPSKIKVFSSCKQSQLRIIGEFTAIRDTATHELFEDAAVEEALEDGLATQMWDDATAILRHARKIKGLLGFPVGYEVSDSQDMLAVPHVSSFVHV